MANRVALGKRGSDFGLFVSRHGEDVLTTSNPLSFDSRAPTSLLVHSYGQGVLVPSGVTNVFGNGISHTFEGTTYTTSATSGEATITHNLGYTPAFAFRWTTAYEIAWQVPGALAPTSSNNSQSNALVAENVPNIGGGSGGGFSVVSNLYVNFGVFLDSGTTLATGTLPTTNRLAQQSTYKIAVYKDTSGTNSNIQPSASFVKDLTSGTGFGQVRLGVYGTAAGQTYSFYIRIQDSAGTDYYIKVNGALSSSPDNQTALQVYPPNWAFRTDEEDTEEDEEEENIEEWTNSIGFELDVPNTNAINIEWNYQRLVSGDPETGTVLAPQAVCHYSYVIFKAPNFLNNRSL